MPVMRGRVARAVGLVFASLVSSPYLVAQNAAPVEVITAAEIARHVSGDSMPRGDTPSRELELTARYVAAQFERAGLGVYPYQSSFIARYPIPLRFDFSQSRITFSANGRTVAGRFSEAAGLMRPYVPMSPKTPDVVLVSGLFPLGTLPSFQDKIQGIPVFGKTILYIAPAGVDSATLWQTIEALASNVPGEGLVVLVQDDATAFTKRLQVALRSPVVYRPPGASRLSPKFNKMQWSVFLRPEVVEGLAALLVSAGIDLAQVRADRTPKVRELPVLKVSFEPKMQGTLSDTTTAPNVIGRVEGTDSVLKNEHIVIVAHMDGLDSANGMHGDRGDNRWGIAGLIGLAKAFASPEARPRRSLLFLAVSGGVKKELWGSTAFASTSNRKNLEGVIPFPVMAAINFDRIGGSTKDSIRIAGLGVTELDVLVSWIVSAHPELQLSIGDGGTLRSPRSDHYPFVVRGIPSLYFSNQVDSNLADPRAAVSSEATDAEHAARIVRLVYYVAREIANAKQTLRWNAEGRQQLLKEFSE